MHVNTLTHAYTCMYTHLHERLHAQMHAHTHTANPKAEPDSTATQAAGPGPGKYVHPNQGKRLETSGSRMGRDGEQWLVATVSYCYG